MCSCGCNTCGTKAPLLKEGKIFQQPLSENLLYHINKKKPLTENTFRYGSPAYLNLWKEARKLYSRDIIDVGPDDRQILTETNLGEYGLFEGELVPLDLPMLEEGTFNSKDHIAIFGDRKGDMAEVYKRRDGYYVTTSDYDFDAASLEELEQKLKQYGFTQAIAGQLREAQYQGKEVPLGKPKRGGSKKFYVYVKNPKTKKIIKVSFGGTTGLTAKINDSEARVNFAKRHNCAGKKDKTKPGYWACRLPRYAKLLGLKGTYSGYW